MITSFIMNYISILASTKDKGFFGDIAYTHNGLANRQFVRRIINGLSSPW